MDGTRFLTSEIKSGITPKIAPGWATIVGMLCGSLLAMTLVCSIAFLHPQNVTMYLASKIGLMTYITSKLGFKDSATQSVDYRYVYLVAGALGLSGGAAVGVLLSRTRAIAVGSMCWLLPALVPLALIPASTDPLWWLPAAIVALCGGTATWLASRRLKDDAGPLIEATHTVPLILFLVLCPLVFVPAAVFAAYSLLLDFGVRGLSLFSLPHVHNAASARSALWTALGLSWGSVCIILGIFSLRQGFALALAAIARKREGQPRAFAGRIIGLFAGVALVAIATCFGGFAVFRSVERSFQAQVGSKPTLQLTSMSDWLTFKEIMDLPFVRSVFSQADREQAAVWAVTDALNGTYDQQAFPEVQILQITQGPIDQLDDAIYRASGAGYEKWIEQIPDEKERVGTRDLHARYKEDLEHLVEKCPEDIQRHFHVAEAKRRDIAESRDNRSGQAAEPLVRRLDALLGQYEAWMVAATEYQAAAHRYDQISGLSGLGEELQTLWVQADVKFSEVRDLPSPLPQGAGGLAIVALADKVNHVYRRLLFSPAVAKCPEEIRKSHWELAVAARKLGLSLASGGGDQFAAEAANGFSAAMTRYLGIARNYGI